MLLNNETEILDHPDVPDALVERAYRDVANIHHWLGDERYMIGAIRSDPLPVRRILDVGCSTGLVLQRVGRALGVEMVGVDIRPRSRVSAPIQIVRADARFEQLPAADVAFCMYLSHHLAANDVVRLIQNVGRYCRRFILLDLVRHPLPLALFRLFLAPLLCEIGAEDGRRSIRRSYTPRELREIVAIALGGSAATFRSSVALCRVRQVVDITYGTPESDFQSQSGAFAEKGVCLR